MSNYSAGHSGELSPDAVLQRINGVLYEEFTRESNPGYVAASNPWFFKQGNTVGIGFIADEDSNVGAFQETGEREEILASDTRIGNTVTYRSQKYTKRIAISDEAFRADMVGKRAEIGRQVGERARMTRDKNAMLDTYADAFAGSVGTTPDGQAAASNAHVTLLGATVDNLETGSMTPDNLWTAVQALANQDAQDGELGGHLFEGLMTNYLLYKTAKEILGSPLEADSGENNLNIFETDFGHVALGASVFLNAANNSATNAATSYHVMGRNHQVTRKVFYDMTTYMTEPQNTDNDAHVLTAKFHEVEYWGSWTAYVGSSGNV